MCVRVCHAVAITELVCILLSFPGTHTNVTPHTAIALTLLDFALFYFPQHATTPEAGFEMIALLIPQLLTLHLARGGNRRDGDTAVPWNSEWAHVVLEEMVGGVIALMAAYVVMVVDARTGNEDEADDDGDDRHISCKVIDDDERHPLLNKSGRV